MTLSIADLADLVAKQLGREAHALGLTPGAVDLTYVPNWGGFTNASFRASDGKTSVRLKLAADSEHVERLARWRSHEAVLRERYRAPRMIGWFSVLGTPREGPVFEWIDGRVIDAVDPRLLEEISDLLGRLHHDADLARCVARTGRAAACRTTYFDVYHDRFTEDLRIVGDARPPFLRAADFEWMGRETAALAGLVDGSAAFRRTTAAPIHGDLWLDNLIRAGDGRLFVLDWDRLGIGDPAFDWAVFLGPSRGALRPGSPTDLPPSLSCDPAFLERFDLYSRAALFDWALDGLSDWIEAAVLGEGAGAVRAAKEECTAAALSAYRERYA